MPGRQGLLPPGSLTGSGSCHVGRLLGGFICIQDIFLHTHTHRYISIIHIWFVVGNPYITFEPSLSTVTLRQHTPEVYYPRRLAAGTSHKSRPPLHPGFGATCIHVQGSPQKHGLPYRFCPSHPILNFMSFNFSRWSLSCDSTSILGGDILPDTRSQWIMT